jgi:hypothetical protein
MDTLGYQIWVEPRADWRHTIRRSPTRPDKRPRLRIPVTITESACESALDTAIYKKGIKVSNAEMKTLNIQRDEFHPEWNYTISPRPDANRSG